MKTLSSLDRRHVSATSVPDVMAVDDVATGTGASIVVALAATIAVILTLVIATLSTVGTADAATPPDAVPARFLVADPASAAAMGVTSRPSGERDVAFLIADNRPVHAGIALAAPSTTHRGKPFALAIVAALLLAMTAATTYVWRAFGRSILQTAPGPRSRRHRNGA